MKWWPGKLATQVSRQKSVKENKAGQEAIGEEAGDFRMMGRWEPAPPPPRLVAMNSPEAAYILLGW